MTQKYYYSSHNKEQNDAQVLQAGVTMAKLLPLLHKSLKVL